MMEAVNSVNPPTIPLSLRQLIRLYRENYKDCFFDWIPDNEDVINSFEKSSESYINSEYLNNDESKEDMIKEMLTYRPVSTFSGRLNAAFSYVILREHEKAKEILEGVETYIADNDKILRDYISPDHKAGFTYLVQGLKQYVLLFTNENRPAGEMEMETEDILKCMLQNCSSSYGDVGEKGMVMIRGVRIYFEERYLPSLRTKEDKKEQIKAIISEDSKTIDWYIIYHEQLRKGFKSKGSKEVPSSEELENLENLLGLDPLMEHVMTKFAVCGYLCNVLKNELWSPNEGPLRISELPSFSTVKEVVNFVADRSEEILSVMPRSKKLNMNVGDFFCKLVPPEHRKPDISEKCYRTAKESSPKSSTCHHKYGQLLYAFLKKYEDGLDHCWQAYILDKTNFPAFMDVIQLRLRNPENEELQTLLFDDNIFSNFDGEKGVNFWFMRGVYHFMKRDPEDPDAFIRAWKKALIFDESDREKSMFCRKLRSLYGTVVRYGWDASRIHIKDVKRSLGERLLTAIQDGDIELIEVIETIQSFLCEPRRPPTYHYRNGNGNRGIGQHGWPRNGRGRNHGGTQASIADADDNWRS